MSDMEARTPGGPPNAISAQDTGPDAQKPPRPKVKRPNYGQIHSKPLPVSAHPLPAFHPSHPLSLLRLAYTWISHILYPPTSHPDSPYVGYFSPETRSVHVTDPRSIRALWEMGFFGKGTLSRSEPSWIKREKARVLKELNVVRGRAAAEDLTNARREERRLFKLERARVERERIERQRLIEEGKLDPGDLEGYALSAEERTVVPDQTEEVLSETTTDVQSRLTPNEIVDAPIEVVDPAIDARTNEAKGGTGDDTGLPNGHVRPAAQTTQHTTPALKVDTTNIVSESEEEEIDIQIDDQEHFQLSLEEAFFLCYGLGVLSIFPSTSPDSRPVSPKSGSATGAYSTPEMLSIFCQHSTFPPNEPSWNLNPDDQFLLNYVAYHHFRSLGWVVRPGVKFAVDYLLYNRGPVFSHAEFGVIVMPAYTHRYWNTPGGRSRRRVWEQKDWWWLHCVNRVQSQVKKTLVLCYVDVPSRFEMDFENDRNIGKLLRSYKVREFVVRRWIGNRNRD